MIDQSRPNCTMALAAAFMLHVPLPMRTSFRPFGADVWRLAAGRRVVGGRHVVREMLVQPGASVVTR